MESPCNKHPRHKVIRYGKRRRFCNACKYTFRVYPKKRGRKKKRQSSRFAQTILREGGSLRGIAEMRGIGREKMRGRFHRSLEQWIKENEPAPPFHVRDGQLILVCDGKWFTIEKHRYTVLALLLRRTNDVKARLRGLYLAEGEESYSNWSMSLEASLKPHEIKQIAAVVSDGSHGMVQLSREHEMIFQRCHAHIKREMSKIKGVRPGKTQHLRLRTAKLVNLSLDTPDERKVETYTQELMHLISHPECPNTVRSRVSGMLRHFDKFRVCYKYPELNIPHTTNSAETIFRFINDRVQNIHGVHSPESLQLVLNTVLCERTKVKCNPKNTNQIFTS